MKILARLLVIILALLLVAEYIPGIEVDGFYTALMVALILGVLNMTIRPILFVLTLPITLLTLGIFSFVLNALLFWFVASFVDGFVVEGFVAALIGAFIISIAGWLGRRIS